MCLLFPCYYPVTAQSYQIQHIPQLLSRRYIIVDRRIFSLLFTSTSVIINLLSVKFYSPEHFSGREIPSERHLYHIALCASARLGMGFQIATMNRGTGNCGIFTHNITYGRTVTVYFYERTTRTFCNKNDYVTIKESEGFLSRVYRLPT